MSNHSIPTIGPKGIQFRSRIEAQWAYVFTTLGWNWEYTETSFIVAFGKKKVTVFAINASIWDPTVQQTHINKLEKSADSPFMLLGTDIQYVRQETHIGIGSPCRWTHELLMTGDTSAKAGAPEPPRDYPSIYGTIMGLVRETGVAPDDRYLERDVADKIRGLAPEEMRKVLTNLPARMSDVEIEETDKMWVEDKLEGMIKEYGSYRRLCEISRKNAIDRIITTTSSPEWSWEKYDKVQNEYRKKHDKWLDDRTGKLMIETICLCNTGEWGVHGSSPVDMVRWHSTKHSCGYDESFNLPNVEKQFKKIWTDAEAAVSCAGLNPGYVYLVEMIDARKGGMIYKFGKTRRDVLDRIKEYKPRPKLLIAAHVANCTTTENAILSLLNVVATNLPEQGREFFAGDRSLIMSIVVKNV